MHSPTLDISLNRSESENMFVAKVLTIVSIWVSRIFLTNGAKLERHTSSELDSFNLTLTT